jgi:hypothetical protein
MGEVLRANATTKPTKNPVITKTGLDILRYICSVWFGGLAAALLLSRMVFVFE